MSPNRFPARLPATVPGASSIEISTVGNRFNSERNTFAASANIHMRKELLASRRHRSRPRQARTKASCAISSALARDRGGNAMPYPRVAPASAARSLQTHSHLPRAHRSTSPRSASAPRNASAVRALSASMAVVRKSATPSSFTDKPSRIRLHFVRADSAASQTKCNRRPGRFPVPLYAWDQTSPSKQEDCMTHLLLQLLSSIPKTSSWRTVFGSSAPSAPSRSSAFFCLSPPGLKVAAREREAFYKAETFRRVAEAPGERRHYSDRVTARAGAHQANQSSGRPGRLGRHQRRCRHRPSWISLRALPRRRRLHWRRSHSRWWARSRIPLRSDSALHRICHDRLCLCNGAAHRVGGCCLNPGSPARRIECLFEQIIPINSLTGSARRPGHAQQLQSSTRHFPSPRRRSLLLH